MDDEAARRLCAAVLLRAVEDVRGVRLNAPTQSPGKLAGDAWEFLQSPQAAELGDLLGIDAAALASRTVSAPASAFLRCGRKPQKAAQAAARSSPTAPAPNAAPSASVRP